VRAPGARGFRTACEPRGASTSEELEREYHQMLIDMNGADFCGMMHYMTFWGSKP